MGPGAPLSRRALIGAGAAFALGACTPPAQPGYAGGWVGADPQRAHRWWRDRKSGPPAPALERRCAVAIAGGGIAGLAAARALRREGVEDLRLFELEDEAGGNSRGHVIDGIDCPLGAHYLPLPGPQAHEVADLLDELGLRRIEHGRAVYDERHLCHSPQERLWVDGVWVDGLVPPAAAPAALQRYAAAVAQARREAGFALPASRAPWTAAHAALDAQPFAAWLDAGGHTDPALRWFLDYCCRDDYGADSRAVSAWAGLHYFASRHGFQSGDDDDRLLTWPEGNAWLARRLAAPLAGRLAAAHAVLRVEETRGAVLLDVWNEAAQRLERWRAEHAVLALPLHVAARVVDPAPPALQAAAARVPHAAWLVANLRLDAALDDQPGAPRAWDNVGYGGDWLGYVVAGHQALRPDFGPDVLTLYRALGSAAAPRRRLLEAPWSAWAAEAVAEASRLHPDLPAKLRRVDLARYGHAMAVPAPGVRGDPALQALRAPAPGRLHFVHADVAGYSVFEEAFCLGDAAGVQIARRLHGRAAG